MSENTVIDTEKKRYPSALHMYELKYSDGQIRHVYACGMTHAYATSREYWPNLEILSINQLDDSWKN
jgi:hypothetical protein